ncbi:MAG: hypothetical protein GY798_15615 [Hyphomicrobiales bacterium]|nr:hypothetical protein [Hyphomicrobiales bacterium]
MRHVFTALALVLLAWPVAAKEMSIQLGGDEAARIATDEAAVTLTVTLTYNDRMTTALTIANASFTPQDVKPVILCRQCEPTYFIAAWDRSSTYGATTGLVLWKRGWWNIAVLPMSVAGIEGPDKNGVSVLIESSDRGTDGGPARFGFRDGRLIDLVE